MHPQDYVLAQSAVECMKAVETHGYENSTLEDIPRPSPGHNEVLIKVNRVQLSVTECWTWSGRFEGVDLQDRIDAQDGLVFGHEFAGEIAEVGEDVETFAVGNRVYAPGKISSGGGNKKDGWDLIDKGKATIGSGGYPGALAEYFVAPTEPLCKLPEDVSNAEGAAMQPLADCLLSVHEAGINTGDVVVVYGAGVMGSQAGQGARYMGASDIYAVDIDPQKLEWADELGMIPIDAREEDPVERVLDATNGTGADVAFEAVGGDQDHSTQGDDPLAQCFQMLRVDGTLDQIGIHTGDIRFGMQEMRMKGVDIINPISVKGVLAASPNMDTGEWAAHMVANDRISIDHMVTHEIEGLDSFEEAVEITTNKKEYDALGPAQIIVNE